MLNYNVTGSKTHTATGILLTIVYRVAPPACSVALLAPVPYLRCHGDSWDDEALPEAPRSYRLRPVCLGSGAGILCKKWRVRTACSRCCRSGECGEFTWRVRQRVMS